MKMKSKLGMGLLAVFGLLVMLLNRPILAIPNGQILGIPSILLYLLGIWMIVIIAMAWVANRAGDQ